MEKPFYCLMEECRRGRFNKSTTVVFLHSGGIFGLFPEETGVLVQIAGKAEISTVS